MNSFERLQARLAEIRANGRGRLPGWRERQKVPPTGRGETRSRAPATSPAKPPDAPGRVPAPSPAPGVEVLPLPAREAGPKKLTVARRELKEEVRLNNGELAPDVERPRVRGDCEGGDRPCPFVGCRYHTYLDINRQNGSIVFNHPGKQPEDISPATSCALDVAARGGTRLEEVGVVLNVTRERIRQIEQKALHRIAHQVDENLVPKKFKKQCKAVDAYTGKSCKLLEHPAGTPHRSERGEFRVVAAPGQTHFEHREQLDRAAVANNEGLEPNHV